MPTHLHVSKQLLAVFSALCLFSSCAAESLDVPEPSYPAESAGDFSVGTDDFFLTDSDRTRELHVTVWYPAARPGPGMKAADYAPAPFRATYETLLTAGEAKFGEQGPRLTSDATPGAEPAVIDDGFPLVLFSHCYNCIGYSAFSIAERLASHGFVVVAPDHTGGTIYEELTGTGAQLGEDFLFTRADDMVFVLDSLLNDSGGPAWLQGRIDAERLGIFGHSFGGATAGLVLNRDKRFKAGLALAVPMANPVFPSIELDEIDVPLLFLLAVEDNSITEFGNRMIRDNFSKHEHEAWLSEVRDAGHLSFTDFCGIVEGFDAGCAKGDSRQTFAGETVTYIDASLARDIAASRVAAFFKTTLNHDVTSRSYMATSLPAEWVLTEHRAP